MMTIQTQQARDTRGRPTPVMRMSFRAFGTDVSLVVDRPTARAAAALERARAVFTRVETACSRFDPDSPLMRANRRPHRWHAVPAECADTVREAARAHEATGGVFDPRILETLLRLGQNRSWPLLEGGGCEREEWPSGPGGPTSLPRWQPLVDQQPGRSRIHLDGAPVDLAGIGKGLAVRRAWQQLRQAGRNVMVHAGLDCRFSGPGPDGDGWRVEVDDPRGGTAPLAALLLTDTGCATTSIRVRRWLADEATVHPLVHPRTGTGRGEGLLSVTVIHPDPAWARAWSETLFLAGRSQVAAVAAIRDLAAVWAEADGTLRCNDAARRQMLWTAAEGCL